VDHVFNEEQRMLRDSVRRLVGQRYSFERRRAIVASEAGWSPDIWAEFADMGLLALPFAEQDGGMGGGALETLIVMEALGRGIVVEPYLPTVVMAGGLLRHGGNAELKARLIPGIAEGRQRHAFAYTEPRSRFNPANVSTRARREGSGYRLDGYKSVVYGAPMADGLFITARTAGGELDRQGISVFYVDAKAPGVSRRDFRTIDGMRASEVQLSGVAVGGDALLGPADQGLALVERVLDESAAAVCAEAAGAMMVLNDKTLEYTRTRVAFGQHLSEFQVIQHRLVDLRVACEYGNAVALMAALKLDSAPAERARAVSAAKAMLGRDSRYVGQTAIQLHGAIGMTDDLDIGHYFKRLTAIGWQFGNADHHLRRFWSHFRGAESRALSKEAA
jgi:alkylation response protein AidB-like acyl-CoA dehydrogenase